MQTDTDSASHQEWQDQLAAVSSDQAPDWEVQYGLGSFGCHELLDRAQLLGDLVEGQLLEHPSCVLREEWYRLAVRAVEALRELYQRVGEEHLADVNVAASQL